jgi:epoxide hydrolase-like predicted phosphatase
MIKAVIFDCFGVLSNINFWHEFLAELNDDEKVVQAKKLNVQCDAGVITRQQFFAEIKELTGKTLRDVESLSSVEGVKNHKLIEYIRSLKEEDYKIAVLSNIGSRWITDVFLTDEEQASFDAMVLSFEVGTTKPDPEVYKIACEKLGVDPEEAVFVDDILAYCTAAEAVGLQAIQYKSYAQVKRDLNAVLNQS